jgi:hypothetical protein
MEEMTRELGYLKDNKVRKSKSNSCLCLLQLHDIRQATALLGAFVSSSVKHSNNSYFLALFLGLDEKCL